MPLFRFMITAALVAFAATAAPAQTLTRVEGQTFESRAQVGGRDLVLNGAGLRTIAFFKAYVAGLYLQTPATTTDQALAGGSPKRLQMRMLMDASADEFVGALSRGIERYTPADKQPALERQRDAFEGQIRAVGKVRRGDVIDLDFVPGSGLVFRLNARTRGEPIAGDDFYAALLTMFIGEGVKDQRLRGELLGGGAQR